MTILDFCLFSYDLIPMCRKSVKVNSGLLRSINLCFLVSHLTYIGKSSNRTVSECVDSEALHPLELVCDIKLPLQVLLFSFLLQVAVSSFSVVTDIFSPLLLLMLLSILHGKPQWGLFDSCFFYCQLIQEVISTVSPGAVIIDTSVPFFLLSMLLLFITAFLFLPCLLMPSSDSSSHYRVFEVKGRLVPTSKFHSVLFCVFWDHGEYDQVSIFVAVSLLFHICDLLCRAFFSKSPELIQMIFEVFNKYSVL